MLHEVKEGFERYPSETAEAVWHILVQAGIVGSAVVVLIMGLILAWAIWAAR